MRLLNKLVVSLAALIFSAQAALAGAPPVRIAVVQGGGSGIEQDIVDRISNALSNNPNVALSTVNPDWYVVCNIKEFMDQTSGQIRYNGSVLIKTTGGHIISTVAVQKYMQDFSLSPGTPLNKALVDKATRDATSGAAERAIGPIENAVQVEMETREKVIQAQMAAEQEEFDQAINALRLVTPDSPHFQNVRNLMDEFAMEKQAKENLAKAQALIKSGKSGQAIALLKAIPAKSRYKGRASALLASIGGGKKKPALAKNKKPSGTVSSSKQADLKALDKALELEKKAIENAQAKVRSQIK